MQRVFSAAGWVKVDADVKGTVLHGLIVSLSKESYLTMPMSQLYLFGRPQITAGRTPSHQRRRFSQSPAPLEAPFTVNGETLWSAPRLTMLVSSAISVTTASRIKLIRISTWSAIMSKNSYQHRTRRRSRPLSSRKPDEGSENRTGGSFHSSGQILILKLAESGKDLSASSTGYFDLSGTASRNDRQLTCCSLPQYFRRNIGTSQQQHDVLTPFIPRFQKCRRRGGSRRLGNNMFIDQQPADSVQHLVFTYQHDLIDQFTDRLDVRSDRRSRR